MEVIDIAESLCDAIQQFLQDILKSDIMKRANYPLN